MTDHLDRDCERCGDPAVMWFSGDGGFFYACEEDYCLRFAHQLAADHTDGRRADV